MSESKPSQQEVLKCIAELKAEVLEAEVERLRGLIAIAVTGLDEYWADTHVAEVKALRAEAGEGE